MPLQNSQKCGQFGRNNCCHRLWKVARSAINCPIWSHCSQSNKATKRSAKNPRTDARKNSPSIANKKFPSQEGLPWPIFRGKGPHIFNRQNIFFSHLIWFLKYKLKCLLNGPLPASYFFIFVFSTISSKYVHHIILQVTRFEPRTSRIGGDHSANWATACFRWWHSDLHFLNNLGHSQPLFS